MPASLFSYVRITAALMIAVVTFAHAASAGPQAAELREREAITTQVQIAWIARDFAKLDALAEEWRNPSQRTSSGYWKLSLFYNHLDENFLARNRITFPLGEDWTAIDTWIARHPQAPTPVILKALMLIRQAQDCYVPPRTARVRRKAPDAFNPDFLKAARDLLDEYKDVAGRDPHWYTALLRVLRLQGASDDEMLLAHADAMAAHPLYYQTHFEVFRDLVERWHPNMKMIDAFANTVLEGTKTREGHQVYARLYEDATIELNQGRMFAPSLAVWNRMRTGYEEINQAYPTAWNAHHFAFNACMAQDGATTRRLFAAFNGETVREAWQSAIIYRQCQEMATP